MRPHAHFNQAVRKFFCTALSFVLLGSCPVPLKAENLNYYEEVQLIRGDMATVQGKGIVRVSITDPNIADIPEAPKPDQVAVMGKAPGQTVLFVWDESGKRAVLIRVVEEDLDLVKMRLEKILATADFKGLLVETNAYEGKVVVSGYIPEARMEELAKITDTMDQQVINMVKKEQINDLIQIDMQVTELGSTLTKELGVDWATGTQTISGSTATTTTGGTLAPFIGEILPDQTGKPLDAFRLGKWYRTTNSALVAKINMLVQEGRARILSKPRLVVISGKEAKFNVGGEIPIRSSTTTASAGGTTSTTVSYKEYGVTMVVTPTLRDGKIDILLNVEIRDIDGSKPAGDSDVAFLTRTATTQLFLDDRQTIVLAGLIKKRDSLQVNKVPFLSGIPILGMLFRSQKTPSANEDSEVVISLTPTILSSASKKPFQADVQGAGNEANVPAIPAVDQRRTQDMPVISKNVVSLPVTVPAEMAAYAKTVQERISLAVVYPQQAQQNGWQGTVRLSLVIRSDGTLKEAYVRDSSGYDVLDQDAVNTARMATPYAPFPANISRDEIALTIPIVYSLDTFLKNVAKLN
jgi:pilus assembly protein CpaC